MARAELDAEEDFINTVGGLINTKENTAGAKRFSPAEMSNHAVFVDAGVAIDRSNYSNMYTSYYPYGGAVALALDLELRTSFKDLSLDNYMAAVWKRFGKTEIPYTIAGLQEVLAQVTGNVSFAAEFFMKYVTGHESFNFQPLLEKAGLLLKKADENKAWMGNVQFRQGEGAVINSNTVIGTPLYKAGLDVDDQLISIDNKPIKKQEDVQQYLAGYKPGDKVSLEYKHHEETRKVEITLEESPFYKAVLYKGSESNAQSMFRRSWYGSHVYVKKY